MTSLDLFKLDGKTAVVTGGSKGIGLYYSEALVQAGARVVVADIDPKAVKETCARLGGDKGDKVLGVDLDVTRRDSVRAMMRRVEERWGRLDILVNNAGLFTVLPPRADPWDIPDEEWDRVMAVNIRGIYTCTAEALPLMRRNPWGRVINISSGLAFKGSPPLIHYAASKGAVVNLTRSMARALGNTGITVNSLAPGATASPTLLAIRPDGDATGQGRPARIIERTEVPEDLIGALLFLASPASDFMTGQTIVVDGGSYLH